MILYKRPYPLLKRLISHERGRRISYNELTDIHGVAPSNQCSKTRKIILLFVFLLLNLLAKSLDEEFLIGIISPISDTRREHLEKYKTAYFNNLQAIIQHTRKI